MYRLGGTTWGLLDLNVGSQGMQEGITCFEKALHWHFHHTSKGVELTSTSLEKISISLQRENDAIARGYKDSLPTNTNSVEYTASCSGDLSTMTMTKSHFLRIWDWSQPQSFTGVVSIFYIVPFLHWANWLPRLYFKPKVYWQQNIVHCDVFTKKSKGIRRNIFDSFHLPCCLLTPIHSCQSPVFYRDLQKARATNHKQVSQKASGCWEQLDGHFASYQNWDGLSIVWCRYLWTMDLWRLSHHHKNSHVEHSCKSDKLSNLCSWCCGLQTAWSRWLRGSKGC